MEQLIEILRRLILVGIWLITIGIAAMFTIIAFSEGQFSVLLVSVGLVIVAWFATKIINWIFIR